MPRNLSAAQLTMLDRAVTGPVNPHWGHEWQTCRALERRGLLEGRYHARFGVLFKLTKEGKELVNQWHEEEGDDA